MDSYVKNVSSLTQSKTYSRLNTINNRGVFHAKQVKYSVVVVQTYQERTNENMYFLIMSQR